MSTKSPRNRRPLIEPLEPRLLFSATADIAVLDDGNSDVAYLLHTAAATDLSAVYDTHAEGATHDVAASTAGDAIGTKLQPIHEIVFIDTSVDGYQFFLDDILQGAKAGSTAVVLLDQEQNGINQISTGLAQYSGLSAVHLISHGSAGALNLGNSLLNAQSLTTYSESIANWQQSLSSDADILLYGCDLAANDAGLALVEQLSNLTQADVAASNDATGQQGLGGDWDLEVQHGKIETTAAVSSAIQDSWHGTLADVSHIKTSNGNTSLSFSDTNTVGQSFLYDATGAPYLVNQLSLQLKKDLTAETQTITVALLDSSNTVLGSDTKSSDFLTDAFTWKTFDFADVLLSNTETYHILITTTGTDGNVMVAGHDSNVYNNSTLQQNGVDDPNGWDLAFKVFNDDSTNLAPVVQNPILSQTTSEGNPYGFTVPSNTFYDGDVNDTLAFSAKLADGNNLPAWLNFAAATQTFSGVPDDGDVGTITIRVTATDDNEASVYNDFDLEIVNVNDAPFVAYSLPDQTATKDQVFSYTMPANTFGDGDVDNSFSYSVKLTNGDALPSWLSFDAASRTFSGTPTEGNLGVYSVEVTAEDSGGASVSDTFDLTVSYDFTYIDTGAGTLGYPISSSVNAGEAFNYSSDMRVNEVSLQLVKDPAAASQIITVEIRDAWNGNILTSASMSSDDLTDTFAWYDFALPETQLDIYQTYWLRVSSSGTDALVSVNYHDADIINNGIFVDNGSGDGARDLAVKIAHTDITSNAPVVANNIADQSVLEDTAFDFTLPADIFSDQDAGDTLTYSAARADGTSMGWLQFDAGNQRFYGTPHDYDPGIVTINVTATDSAGTSVTTSFDLEVINVNDDPVLNGALKDQAVTENQLFNYVIPGDAFTDRDSDAVLTYSAVMADDGILPSWLAFDAATRTFSGAPLQADIGTISVKVVADDGQGGTAASDIFDIFIFKAEAPADVIYESSGTALNGTGVFNGGDVWQSFTESGGNGTYYADFVSVQLRRSPDAIDQTPQTVTVAIYDAFNGTVIGSGSMSSDDLTTRLDWATFDVGNLALTYGQTYFIKVSASAGDTDPLIYAGIHNTDVYGGGTFFNNNGVADPGRDLAFAVAGINDDPVVASSIANQTTAEDTAFLFTFDSNVFNDPDGNTLTYSAAVSGGELPAWLSFDSTTRTFSGTPANEDVGTMTITITADDGNGGAPASTTFDIAVTNTNDVPTVVNALSDQSALEDAGFTFAFAANTFGDVDSGDSLTYAAQLAGGGALPNWLSFDAATRTFSGTPTNADVGTLSLDVTASDGNGGIVTDTFDIVVTNSNDAPTIANGIPNQSVTEDAAFSFTVPANTFDDVDAGDSLIYSAQLAGGGALPNWLSFDAATRTFSGTPTNADVGTLSLDVTASDGNGGIVTDTFDIVVTNINDAPTIANAIADQSATEDTAFSFMLPANTFSDIDAGDSLVYAAQLAGGGALPNWLSFDAASRTFSGTPTNADVGTLSLDVTASDGNGGIVTDTFDIVVTNSNDAPTIANGIPNQSVTEDAAFSFTVPANTFDDVDAGDSLIYSAQLAGGGALPNWLSFDAASRTFSGTPTNANVGTLSLDVTASDGNGGSVSDSFDLVIANNNDAPTIANAIADQSATEDAAFNFTFAANTFVDLDSGDSLAYSAQLAGGGALPSWLNFDAVTRTFSGTPTNADVGTLSLEVTASDGNGGIVTDTFDIVVANTNDAPTVANVIADQSATEDAAFTFTFAANTFVDVDSGDSLAYSAQLSGGGALPGWLNFDAVTRTFSGTPTNADVGTLSLDVIASDGNGGSVSDTFDITVTNVNGAPTIANAIADQSATEDAAFNFTFAANTFADVDSGDSFVYAAQLAGGGALPSWLNFDAVTRTFSGTPANADVGTLSLEITASDGNGGSVSDSFDLVIANNNDAPTIANAIADQSATEDAAFNFTFAANTFVDLDSGDSLAYSAQLSGGGALPSWLNFDAVTRTLSGTPANADVGTLSLDVTASDGNGGIVTDTFDIVVANTNDAPTIANAIPSQSATEGAAFSFTVPANTFDDVDAGDSLIYSAQLVGGGALPNWLSFDAASRTFSGTPTNADVGTLSLDVTASDGNGGSVTSTFDIVVANTNDAPILVNAFSDQSATADAVFVFIVPANAFSDADPGDSLRYSVQLDEGGKLPAWLTFDETTRTLSGVPTQDEVGSFAVHVIATDQAGATVAGAFNLSVSAAPTRITVPEPEIEPAPVDSAPDQSEVIVITPDTTTSPEADLNPSAPAPVAPAPGNTVPDINSPAKSPVASLPGAGSNADANVPAIVSDALLDNLGSPPDFSVATEFHQDRDDTDRHRPEWTDKQQEFNEQVRQRANPYPTLATLIASEGGYLNQQEITDFNDEVNKVRNDMAQILETEQQQHALIAGVTLSLTTGIIIWSLRASSLFLTLFSVIPLWRGVDPLPILDQVNKRKKELEEQRKDKQKEDRNAKEVGYLFDHVKHSSGRRGK